MKCTFIIRLILGVRHPFTHSLLPLLSPQFLIEVLSLMFRIFKRGSKRHFVVV